MWKLAWRNVFRHKVRTAMTLLVVVTGVVGLILSGGFVHDIFVQLAEVLIHSQSGHVQVSRKGYFESGMRSPDKFLIEEPESLRTTVATIPGVQDAMGRLYFSGLLNNGRSDLPSSAKVWSHLAKRSLAAASSSSRDACSRTRMGMESSSAKALPTP